MAAILLQVPDESLVAKVKQACKMLMGVTSVKVERPKAKPVEEKFDITKTAGYKEAMDDVRNGRVTEFASVDDYFKKMGVEL